MILDEDEYYIPNRDSESLYKEKGSKFIAYLYPVQSVEDVDFYLSELKKLHPKARHFCYAYRLSPDSNQYRINDDGEPSGTAGKPIFGQIQSAELFEVFIVVVRYFGGTKLGASGLIRAYKTAAELACDQVEKEITFFAQMVECQFKYAIMGDLMNALKQLQIDIFDKIFDANPKIILKLKKSQAENEILRLKAFLLNRAVEDVDEETEIEGLTINWI